MERQASLSGSLGPVNLVRAGVEMPLHKAGVAVLALAGIHIRLTSDGRGPAGLKSQVQGRMRTNCWSKLVPSQTPQRGRAFYEAETPSRL